MSNTMTPSNLSTLLFTLTLLAAPAAADESPWYLAGSTGQARIEYDFGSPFSGWRVDEEDASANIEVGYRLHPRFAVQAGYRDLGSYTGQPRPCPPDLVCPLSLEEIALLVPIFPTQADFRGVTVSAVPRWPVSERLDLFGRLGVLGWEADLTPSPHGRFFDDPSGTDLLGGIGAEYSVSESFGVLLEYEASELVRGLSLGASWRF